MQTSHFTTFVPTTPSTTTMAPGLFITTTSPITDAAVGSAYSMTFAATGGTPRYTWSFGASSSARAGLALAASGTLSDTPTTSGFYFFFVAVTDTCQAITLATRTVRTAFLSIDASNIYWTGFSVGSGFTGGEVAFVPKPGGAVTVLASNENGPTGITVDSTNVYWASPGDAANTGERPSLAARSAAAAERRRASRSGSQTRPTSRSSATASSGQTITPFNVRRCSLASGCDATKTPRERRPGPEHRRDERFRLLVGIRRRDAPVMPGVASGHERWRLRWNPKQHFGGLPSPADIRVDANAVYWINGTSKEIMKVAK